MALTPGTRIGSYEITAQIGVGGMGEVYRATDTNLGRAVAIKVLPDAVAQDDERLARFDREARTLAALNHPNIATIHGLERAGGTTALVMELVEGPTLADRIAQGALPVAEALPIAKQIAEALEAAHEQGIVHRDLKPANVKVKADGTVKVLDFGLAKAAEPASALRGQRGQTMSPTITTPAMTQAGMILGTAAYMSPEQAKGRPVDKRSDVWAFGAVLFEMLAGRRPFEGEDVSDVMGAVLRLEPQWEALPADLPPAVRALLRGCLVKEPRQRVGDIAAALFVLGQGANLVADGTKAGARRPTSPWRQALPWAAVGAVAAGVSVWLVMAPDPQPSANGGRFVLSAAPSAPFAPSTLSKDLAVSPDGAWVVYKSGAPAQLYVRAISELEGTPLRGTEGAEGPFFSPDSAWIGFNAAGELKKISVRGDVVQTLSIVTGGFRGAGWSSDDTIIVATVVGLFRVPAAGGDTVAVPLSRGSARALFWPDVLPGGRSVLLTSTTGADTRSVVLVDLDTLEERTLFPGESPRYSPTGHILYGVGGTLMAVPFDAGRLEVTGGAVPVVEDVLTKNGGAASFDVSSTGSLVYVRGSGGGNAIVLVDPAGGEQPLAGVPGGAYRDVRVSPDGSKLAVATPEDVWTYDIERAVLTRLTTDAANERSPLWSPDGARVVFTSDRDGALGLFWGPADGSGSPTPLVVRDNSLIDLRAHDWSPDGSDILFGEVTDQIACNFGRITVAEASEVAAPAQDPFCNDYVDVSPDGRWIAYESTRSGREEIFIERYPDLGDRQQVSSGGGRLPRWSADGSELFFSSPDARQMMVVSVRPANTPEAPVVVGRQQPLLERLRVPVTTGWRPYDVFPDGRFVMIVPGDTTGAGAQAAPDVVLVQGFFDELTRRVPAE